MNICLFLSYIVCFLIAIRILKTAYRDIRSQSSYCMACAQGHMCTCSAKATYGGMAMPWMMELL